MKEIRLTKGYVALVDDEDFERVNQFKWSAKECPNTVYAQRGHDGRHTMLHRFILRITDPKIKVDHWDGDGLHNWQQNLRIATRQQNGANRKLNKNNTSGFKGVTWRKDRGKWNAFTEIKTKRIHLGYFDCPLQAACAYDMAAVKYFGNFAKCNFAICT
jgi:hypothetical protein